MRETNFRSVPFNRASVSITTSLYDRRALDCTSDRPLIYSLNHLTYLAASSSRVRETLCTDGGLERLVAILKRCFYNDDESNSNLSDREFIQRDTLLAWKWTLCFQCLVFVGTRGSEEIRTRMASCGIIPVIATVLDNYLQFVAKIKTSAKVASSESAAVKNPTHFGQQIQALNDVSNIPLGRRPRSSHGNRLSGAASIISVTPSLVSVATSATSTLDTISVNTIPTRSNVNLSDFIRPSSTLILDDSRPSSGSAGSTNENTNSSQQPAINQDTQVPLSSMNNLLMGYQDHLPPINPQASVNGGPPQRLPNPNADPTSTSFAGHLAPRAFISGRLVPREEDVVWCLEILAFISKYAHLRNQLLKTHLVPNLTSRNKYDPVLRSNHNHHSLCFSDISNEINDIGSSSDGDEFGDLMDLDVDSCSESQGPLSDKTNNHMHTHNHKHNHNHWDYDTYDFECEQDIDDEYKGTQHNIFPIVEQFTTRQFSDEMKYWSGVIMRNTCRKDDSKGGIRQCANFNCGRWETSPRQFAKCRRCKRTKYCSKDCQLDAWNYHRHWCVPTTHSTSASATNQTANETANETTTSDSQPSQTETSPAVNLSQ